MARRWANGARRITRAIVLDLDPRSAELFATQLSIWFAFSLLVPSPNRPQPEYFWSTWAGIAATCKLVGILPTLIVAPVLVPTWSRIVRGIGNLLGLGFWGMLATFLFLLSRGASITWGGFALLSAVQAWAFCRVLRGR